MQTSPITPEDPPEQAGRFAAAAIAEMVRVGVAPTPPNFQLWYRHCSGGQPELSTALRRLEAGAGFSPAVCAELHEQFLGRSSRLNQVDEACTRFDATMAGLLAEVERMSADAGAYGGKLSDFSSSLGVVADQRALCGLLRQILGETRKVLARTQHLEGELTQAAERIAALRADLASAHREANTDGLTGIANRRCFDQELRAAAGEAESKRAPLSLLLADIDRFKAFNDSFGHQIGDQVLRLVAQSLKSSIKGRDLVARYGGEEFAIILPQTGLEGARTLAEQIRLTVAGQRLRGKATGRELGAITLSIGCAQLHWGEAPAQLVRRADGALQRAKQLGRNRVAVASRVPLAGPSSPRPPAVQAAAANGSGARPPLPARSTGVG